MEILIIIIVATLIGFFVHRSRKNPSTDKTAFVKVPDKWKAFLSTKVEFYRNLDLDRRQQFESDIYHFLQSVRITGVLCDVTIEDRLLIASSAVIPLFGFPAFTYRHIHEVLLYPRSFDRNFNIGSTEEFITGMVGTGAMEGKMILSKPALHVGFDIHSDKKNVGIHEFVHLFDKEDGLVDGIPPGYENTSFAIPWLELVRKKMDEISGDESDINPYGLTNRQEFFAVAAEYFFERPKLMKQKHPVLYEALKTIFNQNLDTYGAANNVKVREPGRNDLCPCGSGLKYKKCCLS